MSPPQPTLLALNNFPSSFPAAKAGWALVHFLSSFGIYGALGFRFIVLRRAAASPMGTDLLLGVRAPMERRTALVGMAGSALLLLNLCGAAGRTAESGKLSLWQAAGQMGPQYLAQLVFGLCLLGLFTWAAPKRSWVWPAAAAVALALALRKSVTAQWTTLVNPLHEVSASLWLGTLFVLVVVGIPTVLRSPGLADRRGPLVARMVNCFSPLALCASALLGVTGVVTSWLKLRYLSALWTTPVGYVLLAKLAVVLVIVGLGGWNWQRLTPKLDTERGVIELRRSSALELWFAVVVLLLTAVLVVMPSPAIPQK